MGSRWYENSPVVIQEAIAAGLPMILPDHGGMKEKSDASTVLYQPGAASSLADALRNLSPAQYRVIRKTALARRADLPAERAAALAAVESVYRSVTTLNAGGSGPTDAVGVVTAPAGKPARPTRNARIPIRKA
jgi:glycosyltransferase involved in cell wall biosynthesis